MSSLFKKLYSQKTNFIIIILSKHTYPNRVKSILYFRFIKHHIYFMWDLHNVSAILNEADSPYNFFHIQTTNPKKRLAFLDYLGSNLSGH